MKSKTLITTVVFNYIKHQRNKIGKPKPYGIEPKTVDAYLPRAKHFISYFHENGIISINQITGSNATELQNHLLTYLEVSTANKVIKLLKCVLEYANTYENILCNTLAAIRTHEIAKPKKYLTKKEIERLEALKTEIPRYTKIIDLFLIQVNTGLSYCDLMELNKNWLFKHHSGNWFIKYQRQKKETSRAIIPINLELINILHKYNYQLPKISNQRYNEHLHNIGDLLNLDFKLTTHVGRKTCGCILLNDGYSLEFVSKVLGHSSINTTQRYYAEVLEDRLMLEMLKKAS